MWDEKLRWLKDSLMDPISNIVSLYASPLQLTLGSLILGILSACALALGCPWTGTVLWILNRIFDGLDGAVARRTATSSALGGYSDIMADFIVYSLIPIALMWQRGVEALQNSSSSCIPWSHYQEATLAIALEASFFVNTASWMFISAILERNSSDKRQTTIVMPVGLIEGAESMVLFTLMMLLPEYLVEIELIFLIGVIFNCFQRYIWAWKNLSK